MKSRYIVLTIALLIGGYFANNQYDKYKDAHTRSEQRAATHDAVKTAVTRMVERFNAVTGWEAELASDAVLRVTPILSLELERSWTGSRPILFLGDIADIASIDDQNYTVSLRQGLMTSDHEFSTSLRLQLRAEKALVERFMTTHLNEWQNDLLMNGVAVIAQVQTITASEHYTEAGEQTHVRTGHGALLEMVYLGPVRLTASDISPRNSSTN